MHKKRQKSFDQIIDSALPPDQWIRGFEFTEGPVWLADNNSLLFSDIVGNTIYLSDLHGRVSVFRRPSNMANGNVLDHQNRLLSCEHATSRVVRLEPDGGLTVLASHWRSRELNSPNDIVVGKSGMIYFTDPGYGRMSEYGVCREQQLDFQGVYSINPHNGDVELLADDFDQPNGLCFSLDQKQLFVSDSGRNHVRVFTFNDGGGLSGGEVWAQTTGQEPGVPDGLKIDSEGNLYSCGPGGIHVFAPDSSLMGVICVPEETANFTWGGPDRMTLFITAQGSVYKMPVKVPGLALNSG